MSLSIVFKLAKCAVTKYWHDTYFMSRRWEKSLTKVFGGTSVSQVIGLTCGHVSERDEPFNALPLEVKNKENLYQSLDLYVEGDLLEGSNAYYCSECNKKVDALKRTCVKSMRDTLIVQLKRSGYFGSL